MELKSLMPFQVMHAGTGSIDAENSAGKTPLALALEAGQFDMAALLQSRGARSQRKN